MGTVYDIREPTARWSARFSLFAAALIVAALVLHRLTQIATPTFLNLVGLGFLSAALGVAIGLYAGGSIWMRGRSGAWSVAIGLIFGVLVWAWPFALMPAYLNLPRINDITTDTSSPPQFATLGKVRGPGANPASYPGAAYVRAQQQAYPDLRTIVVDRSAEEAFEIIVDLVRGRRGLGWKVLVEDAPTAKPMKAGHIEATERSMIVGFVDDIAIRVTGSDREARIDVRSASRFGRHDFGANAARIRRFMREFATRIEATALGIAGRGTGGARASRAGVDDILAKRGLVPRRPIERKSETKDGKRAPAPARQDVQRAPARKAPPQE